MELNNNFQGNQQQNNMTSPPNWNMPTNIPPWYWMYYASMMNGNGGNNSTWNGGQPDNNGQNQSNNSNASNGISNHSIERPIIQCRVVPDHGDIKPGEVPMNGDSVMFATRDLSAIYIKEWGSDCQIHTRTYVESKDNKSNVAPLSVQDIWDNVNSRLERIEALIASIPQQTSNNGNAKRQHNQQKKEVVNNE